MSSFNFDIRASDQHLRRFAAYVITLSNQIGFKVSSRGWCYILEQAGLIDKSKFDKVESWINRARKRGFLPLDFVAEEDARKFRGVEVPESITPVQELGEHLEAATRCENWYGVDWWKGDDHYIQMVVEKVDLVTLFGPVCAEYHIPIGNAKGWSSILQRAEYARRFTEAEDRGLECVLLYYGDHDPDGLRISDFLRKNLVDLQDAEWSDGTQGYDPANLTIDRFGLNFDFIEEHGFTWIDNLITGSGANLADPSHKNHEMPYVQEYLSEVGERKCEANVLVTQPDVARDLVRSAIEKHLGGNALERFRRRRRKVQKYVETFRERSGLNDFIEQAMEHVDNEADLMAGMSY